jgi:hypothetical protein
LDLSDAGTSAATYGLALGLEACVEVVPPPDEPALADELLELLLLLLPQPTITAAALINASSITSTPLNLRICLLLGGPQFRPG